MGSEPQMQQQAPARPLASNGMVPSTLASGGLRFPSLTRQASIYSLTLDEFQNAMGGSDPGKNFGSMNMDEFLKNIWTAEESQAMAEAIGDAASGAIGINRQPSLQRQGSLVLPRTMSALGGKTVDDVWKDIQQGNLENGGGASPGTGQQQRQATFAEMTLEDFLVKAGVVREDVEIASLAFGSFGAGLGDRGREMQGAGDRAGALVPTLSLSPANALPSQASIDAMQLDAYKNQAASQQQAEWMRSLAQQHQQQQIYQQQADAFANAAAKRVQNGPGPRGGIPGMGMGQAMAGGMGGELAAAGLGAGLNGGMGLAPVSPQSPFSDSNGNGHTLSPANYGMEGALRGRKRGADGPVEKVVERRQRRMIKNRESAARSRARKQAYTVELEAEVTQLKEENTKLRKQQVSTRKTEEDMERRKKRNCESMVHMPKPLACRNGLRRTLTGPW